MTATAQDPSAESRRRSGRRVRRTLSRERLGRWNPAADRLDPAGVLQAQARTRVPDLVPLRHGRMLSSPFAFFRGAAAIMAADLAVHEHSGLIVQLAGDAHVSNFSARVTAERQLVFDLDDFDETLPGPFEWDLKRLVASLAIAGRSAGMSEQQRRRVTMSAVSSYRESMLRFAGIRDTQPWYQRPAAAATLRSWRHQVDRRRAGTLAPPAAKARPRDNLLAVSRLTTVDHGQLRFVRSPPIVVPINDQRRVTLLTHSHEPIGAILEAYRSTLSADRQHLMMLHRYVDTGTKVAGVGSLGTRSWITLMERVDRPDVLLVQIKEAEASILEAFLAPGDSGHHGQRVVDGQRVMQAVCDPLLGWYRTANVDGTSRDFYVRQVPDWRLSADVGNMDPIVLAVYAQMCGWTLARAHARSGDRAALAGYLGHRATVDESLADFAEIYADQNDLDYRSVVFAAELGRIPVQAETRERFIRS